MKPLRVFVYGSLLVAPVVRAVLRRTPEPLPATLGGYRRMGLRGHDFPGIVRRRDARTAGAVLRVSGRELRRLDAFEDDFYLRRRVRVRLADGRRVGAMAYVLRANARRLTHARQWSCERFAARWVGRRAGTP